MKRQIIFRTDAGNKFGLGHLSRCLALAEELIEEFLITFIVKTDDINKVKNFTEFNYSNNIISNLHFLETGISKRDDLDFITQQITELNGFLVLDHYSIDLAYQLHFREKNIKWLQFDSYANMDLHGDLVLHASPAATNELYKPLQKNKKTKFLLGTNYAIVNKRFAKQRSVLMPRNYVKSILICFGGGNDRGATLYTIKSLDNSILKSYKINILISSKNPDSYKIQNFIENYPNISMYYDSSNIDEFMVNADIGFISPGTLSYEAACLGLPMLLITIADNQIINAAGWENAGCAINLGNFKNLDRQMNKEVGFVINNTNKLQEMSEKGLNSVDGHGAGRVKKEILLL